MASETPESSRAGDEAARQLQPPWVALSAIPVVHGAADDAAEGEAIALGTADVLLEHRAPPRASYIKLPERLVPDARRRELGEFACIVASAPGCILIRYTEGGDLVDAEYFLCDLSAGTTVRLPAVPEELPFKLSPDHAMGLVPDPRRPGQFVVVSLHATPMAGMRRHDALLFYATASAKWTVKPLAAAPGHEPWLAHRVFAHGGLLFSVDPAYGILYCDPFDDHPDLFFFRLPLACQMLDFGDRPRPTMLIDQRRCFRPSEGILRYAEISGLSYDPAVVDEPPINAAYSLYSLVNPAGPNQWKLEYSVPFSQIWKHPTYLAAGLPQDTVPKLGLIDPENHYLVFFFVGSSLFGWNALQGLLRGCEQCVIDPVSQQLDFQSSRYIDAWRWELPAPTARGDGHADGYGAGGNQSSFGRGMEGFRGNIIRIDAPNPLRDQRQQVPAPAQPQARGYDERPVVQQSIREVDRKLREGARSRKAQHKLGRGLKQLKSILGQMDSPKDHQ